ncbi:MAG: sulfatase-like hydrolase/transferase [Pirellulales bacterium]|nr:sulfatase-like hydrolase/transferase [Pirellulales bacterium]
MKLLLFAFVFLSFLIVVVVHCTCTQANTLPNVVLICEYALGYGDVSHLNQESKIDTINLDRLAEEGITFTDAHVPATQIAPSRVGLLSGTVPSKLKIPNVPVDFGPMILRPETLNLAQLLKNAGYETAYIGHWGMRFDTHLQAHDGQEFDPARPNETLDWTKPLRGPDLLGFDYSMVSNFAPHPNHKVKNYSREHMGLAYFENGIQVGQVFWNKDNFYQNDLETIHDHAIDYLEARSDRLLNEKLNILDPKAPFFLVLSTHCPHEPWKPANSHKGFSKAGTYGDYVLNMDSELGRIINHIDEIGIAKNTIVIVTSISGPSKSTYSLIDSFDHFSMGKWRGTRWDLYEGGHRVPLVVRWPNVIQPGRVCDSLVNLTDWMATFAHITNQKIPKDAALDSTSLLPLLQDKVESVRDMMLVSGSNWNSVLLRRRAWSYIPRASGHYERFREARSWNSHHNFIDPEGFELFNLEETPQQTHNLINVYPEVVKEMHTLLWQLMGTRAKPARSTQSYETTNQ